MLFIARCVSCFFGLEMRHFLPVVIALQCAHLATAGTLPLTGKDIVLMLRMGYSTEDVERELEAKHFVCPLDANSEGEIRDLNGSSQLLDTLKSGRLNATKDEVAQAEQKNNSLVYQAGRIKVVYLDAIDTPQNHIRLGVISE